MAITVTVTICTIRSLPKRSLIFGISILTSVDFFRSAMRQSRENLQENPTHTALCVKGNFSVLWLRWPLCSTPTRAQCQRLQMIAYWSLICKNYQVWSDCVSQLGKWCGTLHWPRISQFSRNQQAFRHWSKCRVK